MNQVFIIFIIISLLSVMIVGELWIHQRVPRLFPRYFIASKVARQQGEDYQFNENEYNILVKLGRRMVMLVLIALWVIVLLLTITKSIVINYGIVMLIALFFLFIYHYHASFND